MIVRGPVGPVQVLPPGLLNMLQLKSSGYNPDALKQDIQPTIDMTDWWLRATRKNWGPDNTVLQAAGSVGGILVPLGPGLIQAKPGPTAWWYVHRATIKCSAITAETSQLQFGIIEPGGAQGSTANDTFHTLGEFRPSLAADQAWIFNQQDFWLPPGSSFGMYVGAVAATGSLFIELLGCSYSELPL